MRKLMMLSALAALMLGGSAYAAGVDDATVNVKAPQTYKLHKSGFDDFANRYALSNDQVIKFSQSGGRYWARLKLEDRAELFPVSANTFVTAAGTRIEFRDHGEEVVIDNFERLPMSVAMTETNVRVTAAR